MNWVLPVFSETVLSVVTPITVVLLVLDWLSRHPSVRLYERIRGAGRGQVLATAAISAFPGCAGGIAVAALYLRGYVTPASFLGANIATGGDAAFVLLVGRPLFAIGVFAGLAALAVIVAPTLGRFVAKGGVQTEPSTGVVATAGGVAAAPAELADVAPAGGALGKAGDDADARDAAAGRVAAARSADAAESRAATRPAAPAWLWAGLQAAAFILAALVALDLWKGGATAADVASLAFTAVAAAVVLGRLDPGPGTVGSLVRDVSEITLWVALADLLATYLELQFPHALDVLRGGGVWLGVLVAALVGAIPGCGPQIAVTGLFVAGLVPVPVLLANYASQKGDMIFPVLRAHPRAAWQVTVITAVLGLAVGAAAILVLPA